MELARRIVNGDRRAAARAITLIENENPVKRDLLKALHPHTGNAYLVGITGAPGAGKSTLTDQLLSWLRQLGHRVGVIAVDPTSPFTGGAILGDRIRMTRHTLDPGVFIRSMGTRGSLGGLARATREAVRVLDAYGADVVLIETVGVGQSELDIMHVADTTVVVLPPAAGDHIQTMKAGIMEIADVFAVNKADLPGADKTEREVNNMLDLLRDLDWRPPVVRTTSQDSGTVQQLWEACHRHRAYLQESGQWEERRRQRWQEEILEIVEQNLSRRIRQSLATHPSWQQLLGQVARGEQDPYQVADLILEWYNTTISQT